jgi:serine/threonine protein phosphatase PrpC
MTARPSRQGPAGATGTSLRARSVSRSHVGLVRAINEDRVFDCPEAGIWAVADGMGGHAGGDLAAQAVVDRLRLLAKSGRSAGFADVVLALRQANDDIRERNRKLGIEAGATVAAVTVQGSTVHVVWAGDSRVYRLRNRCLELLTTDHSLVQELVDAGLVTSANAPRHPQSHIVTRALGVNADAGLQMLSVSAEPGDRFLICTDGLSRSLVPADTDDGAINSLADRCLSSALVRDGSDNASLVIVELLL